jgi:hypothetical protein
LSHALNRGFQKVGGLSQLSILFLISTQFHSLAEDHNKAVLVYCADDGDGPLPHNNSQGIVMVRAKQGTLREKLLKAADQIVIDHIGLGTKGTSILGECKALRKENSALRAMVANYKQKEQNTVSDQGQVGPRRGLQRSQDSEEGRTKQVKKRLTKK